ncbi:hypothetical protein MUA04_07210 [Enterobacteriaceae bacterium H11S18]|uniref:hypothetical protein n=1 Tax=Dryocola clanedunensis TaxID=2925396 RepID=UPI0022F008CE|nr:hypothetical protein [Dryocola clanedunensis]MCT4709973.1 hypothetical protein [Dryocola clanedunensis]
MNKPKSQRFDLTTMTGEQIAQLILFGKYTKSALWAFISRNGGADAAHARYPQIAVALHILKQERKKAKKARAFKTILKPLSEKLADGHSLTSILDPVLQGYRQLYRDKLGLDLTPEQVILFLITTDCVESLESYGYTCTGDFPTATAV